MEGINHKKIQILSVIVLLNSLFYLFLKGASQPLGQILLLTNILVVVSSWYFSDSSEDHWSIYAFTLAFKVSTFLYVFWFELLNHNLSFKLYIYLSVELGIVYLLFQILHQIYSFYFASEDLDRVQIEVLKNVKTNNGEKVWELSFQTPVLLVFVRHFGCTFCRETVSDISKIEDDIKSKGMNPIFVHMSDPSFGDLFFSKYIESDVSHISDPNKRIYKSFGLKQAKLTEFLTFKIWARFFHAGILKGHWIGKIEADALQLGGIFLIHEGKILSSNVHSEISSKFKMPL